MATSNEKQEVQRTSNEISKTSNSLREKDAEDPMAGYLPRSDEEYNVTLKTWCVVSILALSYGISFWIVPSLSACAAVVAAQLGDPTKAAWYVSLYTMTVTIAFMVCGANSDLFGRRWFIVGGNAILFVGFIVGGSAKNNTTMLAAMSLIGFGAGNAQLAAFALPELLPNKWRAAAIVFADIGVYFAVLVGPVAGAFAAQSADTWRWLFYAPAIAVFFSFLGLFFFYYPPKHPRGLPTTQALKELDYIGAILFIASATLILVGIVYTTTLPSKDPKVIGTLVSGFTTLVAFALWETFAPLTQPLTPTHVFTRDKGRELTAPFIVGFVVTMFYYAVNIIYPTQIATLFTDATTDYKYRIVLGLPGNLGLCFGALLLTVFGHRIGHWKWTLTASVTVMVVFGALLALGNPQRKGMMIAFVFLCQVGFGWAQYLSIAFIQFGVPQVELGISGGLAGVSRFAGGAVAISVYQTILTNVQSSKTLELVPTAATAAGLPSSSVSALLAALPLGATALAKVPGITNEIIAAAGAAFQQAYVVGLRTTALSSLSFGILAIIACCFCNDIGPKMDNKIEVFLENDENAEKNRYH
ncbi:MFS general substrate transporter [Cucurbitaria berberidis CBS 394.84]|uniref:MFS general substrate transporter n=1 Tax=Cucurbitaria berberidis CBS 394.84 TaxID=1168544 RepID=A0A9P4LA70_9PLEO|nr:MFS general substrate transporter [Cucurbitaria berberidis CBS 394.84]KAF1847133.1 MFS general substrate transporter [Cucurbitaria berberidis CBS 394.84]